MLDLCDMTAELLEMSEDSAVLLQKEERIQKEERPSEGHKKLCSLARYVSPEVVVFSFIFVFYYYQSYLRQYLIQWYAIKCLLADNITLPSVFVCYNQTLVNDLSGSNSTFDEVEKKAAYTNLLMMLTMYIPSMIANLIISPFSDKYGRKPVMITVLSGKALAVVLCVFFTYLKVDVYWFLVSSFVAGISGGLSTMLSVSFAYVSDITPERWRTPHLGLIQAVVYISIALSSGVFNVWLESADCNFEPISWLMVAVIFSGLLYSLVMPESLPKQKRIVLRASKRGFSVLSQGIKMFFWPRSTHSLWRLWFVALSMFIVVFGESGENSIATFFLLHKPLEWSRNLIGIYQVVRAAAHGFALFVILPLLSCLKCPDIVVALLGIAVTVATNIFLGFVEFTWQMYLGKYRLFMYVMSCMQGCQNSVVPPLKGNFY